MDKVRRYISLLIDKSNLFSSLEFIEELKGLLSTHKTLAIKNLSKTKPNDRFSPSQTNKPMREQSSMLAGKIYFELQTANFYELP